MKLLKVLCVAAIAIAIAAPSFAAVQNIKVSGSIEERAIFMNNFDLRNKGEESLAPRVGLVGPLGSGASIHEDSDDFILSTIRVGVESDLTDNVSAAIVLANQARWGDAAGATDVDVNKAYITLKEFFYQPLTLKIGRQDLMFGTGFIIGPGIFRDPSGAFPVPRADNFADPITSVATGVVVPVSGPMGAQYSISTYYDAIRATLDFDPWTIDGIYAKIVETDTGNDDEDLMGVNIAHKFDVYNAKAEGYWFYKRDDNLNSDLGYIHPTQVAVLGLGAGVTYADQYVPGVGTRVYEAEDLHTLGLRGDIEPVEDLTLQGEGAFQVGKLYDDAGPWGASTNGGSLHRTRNAWAVDLSGNYLWKDVDYKPNFGLGYVFRSGNKQGNSGKFKGWDPMFRGKFYSLIRDYQYGAGAAYDQQGGNIYRTLDYLAPSGSSNSHLLYVDGGLVPMEDLTLKARYLNWWAAEKVNSFNSNAAGSSIGTHTARGGRHIGQEIDTSLVYDYTEDVQFDLSGGLFFPGNLFDDNIDANTKGDNHAIIVTGGVKVVF
ncbi:MAG: alginate export family protein [Candidatus Omnitrophota bacterium]|nr:alginate export family protein [Candidatus Omnitrophota bacterium]